MTALRTWVTLGILLSVVFFGAGCATTSIYSPGHPDAKRAATLQGTTKMFPLIYDRRVGVHSVDGKRVGTFSRAVRVLPGNRLLVLRMRLVMLGGWLSARTVPLDVDVQPDTTYRILAHREGMGAREQVVFRIVDDATLEIVAETSVERR